MPKYKHISYSAIVLSILLLGIFICYGYYNSWFGDHMVLTKSSFDKLPGWNEDDHRPALTALKMSCTEINELDPNSTFNDTMPQGGKVFNWQKICAYISDVKIDDATAAKKFFETWFIPYRITNNFKAQGLFTGYYLAKLNCSLKQSQKYHVPIHAIPNNLVSVDLELFDKKMKGKKITGSVVKNRLCPYEYDSKAIRSGAINDTVSVLMWCDDKVDVAFAHIQGSALARLENGENILIGYHASNGRPYTAIGRVLVERKEISPQNKSMHSIREWFSHHPEQIDNILNENASYIFFRILDGKDPIGSEQVPLTAERSLAVDKRYIPLGTPIWLDTKIPDQENSNPTKLTKWQRLLIAQDTGGAIKGIVRGDVYWGYGERAEFIAGHMKSEGRYWILLPRTNIDN